ncbi:uncharacterized protein LOC111908478 [Lactuca sativa]|uniref:NB-ARC domain-containing protein n=2 Tax=Lactuca sativa TaxID=4236 RepID=A0A9R1WD91_LACSA|nr:uncharacterized protein LOC111908478 [Lactuca sativa]XP_023760074.1 uncharacterized protein LOC111908478 [Lactuca sativa]KAJ0220466.1 hypothetical protein LSAT_V11C200052430 [Lactuca sativa]
MECLTGIFSNPFAQCLIAPVKEHLCLLIFYTQYVGDMLTAMTELNAAKDIVEERKNQNVEKCFEAPNHVNRWLEDVQTINRKVECVLNDNCNWFNLCNRYTLAVKALEITQEIDHAMKQLSQIEWTDDSVPLGRNDSTKASTSTPSSDYNDFESREHTFRKALEALGSNHTSHMVALWGMGGVGKTTMMKRLKKIIKEKRTFHYIVLVVIKENMDLISIQDAVADYLDMKLIESNESERADKLREGFQAKSDGGKNRFLIILDDVWQSVDMEDIGLSPFPNQGVDFKVLLTSENKDVCAKMGVEANLIFDVKFLTEEEAQSLFYQFVKVSDPHLDKIGKAIVRKCGGLPIAIKTIANTLKSRNKDVWKDALSRIEHHDIETIAHVVFQMSYDNLQNEEAQSIFLLCGLFPEDFDIPTEELVRYGWGLRVFNGVYTIGEARHRLNAYIELLKDSNLLIESDDVHCVKMHDLVRAFVLDTFNRFEHSLIVNHGNGGMLGWPENDMSASSCKRISLICKGMSDFPRDVKFPNLLILKLMHGDKSLKFPQDFYGEMKKLQVISYDHMKYPLLPTSPQCSTNLRVLHLHQCSLMFDCSSIGNLLNLEVLSFANSGIEWLPSTIGNLKELRVLDLTNCDGLRIDNGVLKKLVKLEELYMRVGGRYQKAISFTDENCNEMAERSKNLSALEFEFFKNNAQPKNMSFENLERFKISVGCYFKGDFGKIFHSFENTLRLVTNRTEVLESRLNELFEKTDVLYLSVGDMNDLEDVEVKLAHLPKSSSFHNLRVLIISECIELRYLFTLDVANTLSKLEHLQVYECDNMEEIIHTEGRGEVTITFPKLKFLSLCGLPNLLGLCGNVHIINLPQLTELKLNGIPGFTSIYPEKDVETSSLLNKEVVIPNLEKLDISYMKDLKEIWPCELGMSQEVDVSTLRVIKVSSCDNLVNLFPCNPMPLIHHLEELQVIFCGSIEVLFNIELDSIGQIGEGINNSSLRIIQLQNLGKLSEVWRIKGADNSSLLISGFQGVESIIINKCKRFRNVFTPTSTNFDMGALMEIRIQDCGEKRRENELVESSQEQEQIDIAIPFTLTHSFQNLRKLALEKYEGVEVVFEIESPTSRELVTIHHNQQPLLPNLELLDISFMDSMSHVWKCNWNKFFILQKQQSESPFCNLTTIHVQYCQSIKYLFSTLMAKLLSNLKKVEVRECHGIEEVVSNRDDEDEEKTTFTSTSSEKSTNLFPRLESLALYQLPNLKCIGGGGSANSGNNEISLDNSTTTSFVDQSKFYQAGGIFWTLCQYSREINIRECYALSSVIPCYAAGQMQKVQVLNIYRCNSMKELFETQGMNNNIGDSGCDEGNGCIPAISRLNNVIMLPNLKILKIEDCGNLEHVFTFSALESLKQLEELTIEKCKAMKVIVKEEDEYGEQTTKASSKEVVVFPRLKSIELENLQELMGFYLGKNEIQWPSLDKVMIKNCPEMMVFAPGESTAPKRKYINTSFGIYGMEEVLETQGMHNNNDDNCCDDGNGGIPRLNNVIMFPNIKILQISNCGSLEHIFTFSALESLIQLKELTIADCKAMKVIVKEEYDVEQTRASKAVVFSCLKSITLCHLPELVGFFLGKNEFWWPSLDKVTIIDCPQMMVFTPGGSTTPHLKYIHSSLGKHTLECGLNFQVTTTAYHQTPFLSLCPATSEGMPWSFHNLIEVSLMFNDVEKIIPSNELLNLQKLEKVHVRHCNGVEEVFEALEEGTNSSIGFDELSQTTTLVKLPNLTQVELEYLDCLRYIWKTNQWTAFEFPNLTTVTIRECHGLEHVFTSSMVGSLLQLQELHIYNCKYMEEVIARDADVVEEEEEDDDHDKRKDITLPFLKTVTLASLPRLKGFWLGKEDFSFPLLDTLSIEECPAIMTFTKGNSATPKLKEIEKGKISTPL